MCGIIARVGRGDAGEPLLNGLENLEYRGYDSAGVAIQNGSGIAVRKRKGEIEELVGEVADALPHGEVGIGHTRWSTHGAPTDENAHPHTDCAGRVAVVHNGIIENHADLRRELEDAGHAFESETDSEVVPHLIERHLSNGAEPAEAFRLAVHQIEGSYAIAAIVDGVDTVYASRQGSPLVLGLGSEEGEHFLASDVPAFLEYTDRVVFIEDGDVVELSPGGYHITDADRNPVERDVEVIDWNAEETGKGSYNHFMEKEIHSQPSALRDTIRGRVDAEEDSVAFEDFPPGSFEDIEQVQFVGCGTSYHAGLFGASILAERGVDARASRASEYKPCVAGRNTLVVGVTQSGETADTLNALRAAADEGQRTLAVTNVVGSTAARESDDALFIRAGPEIGVAATKTFSSQTVTLLLLAERLAEDIEDGEPSPDRGSLFESVEALPDALADVLRTGDALEAARAYEHSNAYFFIGNGRGYPVAMEGALKFKEITYEHAEGFPAGELKHGPLALVTPDTPVVAILTGEGDDRTLQNATEAAARGADVITVGPRSERVDDVSDCHLDVPDVHPAVASLLANVHLQLLAYHTADRLGRSIDKPRNLAKSVTVE